MRTTCYLLIMVMCVAGTAALPFRGWGQKQLLEDTAVKARLAIRRLAGQYQQARFLSFDILYRYAAENKPGEYLDSLRGQYKLHGSRYWSLLDNQESLFNDQLMLMIFPEDSLVYLAAPKADRSAESGTTMNLPAMIDTFLLTNKEVRYTYAIEGAGELVGIILPGPVPCKKITWHIDRKTGYLTKMVSLVQADQLYDPSVRSLVTGAADTYVVVEALYNNYRQGAFDESVFDLGKYIRKEGQEYVTVAPYERYKVFIGTPGL